MIPKILCWLFGHKQFTDVFTGKYGQVYNPLTVNMTTVPVVRPEKNEVCPRCGAKL